MTLTISKCKLSKQQHTITLDYTLGENEKNSLIFTLMICRNFFAHRNAVCKTRDGLAHLIMCKDRIHSTESHAEDTAKACKNLRQAVKVFET